MNIFKKEWFWVVVIVVVLVTGVCWIANRTVEASIARDKIRTNHIYEHGVTAGNLGVPAQANPSIRRIDREIWLNGWIDGNSKNND